MAKFKKIISFLTFISLFLLVNADSSVDVYRFQRISAVEHAMKSDTGPIDRNRVKNIKIEMDQEKKRIINVDRTYSYMDLIKGMQVLGLVVRGTFLKNLMLEAFHPIAKELVDYVIEYEKIHEGTFIIVFAFNDVEDNFQATVSEFLKAYAEKSNRIPREYLQLVSGGDFDMEYITFGFGPIARHGSKDLMYYIMNYFAPNRKQLTKENIANDGLITLVDQTIGVYRFANMTQEERAMISETGPIDENRIKKFTLSLNAMKMIDEDYSYMNLIEGFEVLGIFIPRTMIRTLQGKDNYAVAQELVDYVDEYERRNINTKVLLFICGRIGKPLFYQIGEFLKVYREKNTGRNPRKYLQTLGVKDFDKPHKLDGFGWLKKHIIPPVKKYFETLSVRPRVKLTTNNIEQHKLDFSDISDELSTLDESSTQVRRNRNVQKQKSISVYRFREITDRERAMISSTGPINKDRVRNIKFEWDSKKKTFTNIDEEFSYMDSIEEYDVLCILIEGELLDQLTQEKYYDHAAQLVDYVKTLEEFHPEMAVLLIASYNTVRPLVAIISEFLKVYAKKDGVNPRSYLQICSYGTLFKTYATINFGPIINHDSKFLGNFLRKFPVLQEYTIEDVINDVLDFSGIDDKSHHSLSLTSNSIDVYRFKKVTSEEQSKRSTSGPIDKDRVKNILIPWDNKENRLTFINEAFSYMDHIEGMNTLALVVAGTMLKISIRFKKYQIVAGELVDYVDKYERNHPDTTVILFGVNGSPDERAICEFLKVYAKTHQHHLQGYMRIFTDEHHNGVYKCPGFEQSQHRSDDLTEYFRDFTKISRKKLEYSDDGPGGGGGVGVVSPRSTLGSSHQLQGPTTMISPQTMNMPMCPQSRQQDSSIPWQTYKDQINNPFSMARPNILPRDIAPSTIAKSTTRDESIDVYRFHKTADELRMLSRTGPINKDRIKHVPITWDDKEKKFKNILQRYMTSIEGSNVLALILHGFVLDDFMREQYYPQATEIVEYVDKYEEDHPGTHVIWFSLNNIRRSVHRITSEFLKVYGPIPSDKMQTFALGNLNLTYQTTDFGPLVRSKNRDFKWFFLDYQNPNRRKLKYSKDDDIDTDDETAVITEGIPAFLTGTRSRQLPEPHQYQPQPFSAMYQPPFQLQQPETMPQFIDPSILSLSGSSSSVQQPGLYPPLIPPTMPKSNIPYSNAPLVTVYRFRRTTSQEKTMVSSTGPINENRMITIKIKWNQQRQKIVNVDPNYSYMNLIEGHQVLGFVVEGTLLEKLLLPKYHLRADELVSWVREYEDENTSVLLFALTNFNSPVQSIFTEFLNEYKEKSDRELSRYLQTLGYGSTKKPFGPIFCFKSKRLTNYFNGLFKPNRVPLTPTILPHDELEFPIDDDGDSNMADNDSGWFYRRHKSVDIYRFKKITPEEYAITSETGPINYDRIKNVKIFWDDEKKELLNIDERYSYMNLLEGMKVLGIPIYGAMLKLLQQMKNHVVAQELVDYVEAYENYYPDTAIILIGLNNFGRKMKDIISEFLKVYKEKTDRDPYTYFQLLEPNYLNTRHKRSKFGPIIIHKCDDLTRYFNDLFETSREKLTIENIKYHGLDFGGGGSGSGSGGVVESVFQTANRASIADEEMMEVLPQSFVEWHEPDMSIAPITAPKRQSTQPAQSHFNAPSFKPTYASVLKQQPQERSHQATADPPPKTPPILTEDQIAQLQQFINDPVPPMTSAHGESARPGPSSSVLPENPEPKRGRPTSPEVARKSARRD